MKTIFLAIVMLISVIGNFVMPTVYAQEKATSSSVEITPERIQKIRTLSVRTKMLRGYLESQNSPLAEHAETFVRSADTYNLDWRFVAAISGIESSFGQHLPQNSYNAWGWGIYGDNMIRFSSYDVAIETISKDLRGKYMDKWGAKDVYQIGRFYASSPTWADRVTYFMNKMEDYETNNQILSLSPQL